MSIQTRKVGVIGVGRVGSHVASALICRAVCDEIVLIDTDQNKVTSHGQDLADSTVLATHTIHVKVGNYSDLKDADIVVISACGQIFAENRLDELAGNLPVVNSIIENLNAIDYQGMIVSITNPCDVIACHISNHTKANVIGTGTLLDSSRFISALSRETGIAPKSIQAYCLGEHGDSQVLSFSSVSLMGKSLAELETEKPTIFGSIDRDAVTTEVVKAGWKMVTGKGATEFGIGHVAAELVKTILHDEKRILPCSTRLNGEYGQEGVYASLPCVVGANGVEYTMPPTISEDEKAAFIASCDYMRQFIPA